MAWGCAECGKKENEEWRDQLGQAWPVKFDAVCHHCGSPLCQEHRVVIVDDAFSPGQPTAVRTPAKSVHCKACKGREHPRAPELPGWTGQRDLVPHA